MIGNNDKLFLLAIVAKRQKYYPKKTVGNQQKYACARIKLLRNA